MKIDSASLELLNNLYNFYKKRYNTNQTQFEEKFNVAVEDLISTGDIQQADYIKFCITHDIEPKIEPKVKTTKKSSSSSIRSSDPCGGGGYSRSSC